MNKAKCGLKESPKCLNNKLKPCKHFGKTCECNHFEDLPKCYEPEE